MPLQKRFPPEEVAPLEEVDLPEDDAEDRGSEKNATFLDEAGDDSAQSDKVPDAEDQN